MNEGMVGKCFTWVLVLNLYSETDGKVGSAPANLYGGAKQCMGYLLLDRIQIGYSL